MGIESSKTLIIDVILFCSTLILVAPNLYPYTSSVINIISSSKVFYDLPIEQKAVKRLNRKERFLDSLPKQFCRQEYLDLATKQNIPHKTAEGYITKFVEAGLIHREKKGVYINQ